MLYILCELLTASLYVTCQQIFHFVYETHFAIQANVKNWIFFFLFYFIKIVKKIGKALPDGGIICNEFV